jgi:hypothetical protein
MGAASRGSLKEPAFLAQGESKSAVLAVLAQGNIKRSRTSYVV